MPPKNPSSFLFQSFVNRGSSLLSSNIGAPGVLAFNENPTMLNDTPTDDAGSQGFFSLDLQNFSDGENSAQAWTRQSTGLAPSDPLIPPIESAPLGVLGQRQLTRNDTREESRSLGQLTRDRRETSRGEFITGNQYLETTGRIDARAEISKEDLNNQATKNRYFGGDRGNLSNDNDEFFGQVRNNNEISMGNDNDAVFDRARWISAQDEWENRTPDQRAGEAAREFMAAANKLQKNNSKILAY